MGARTWRPPCDRLLEAPSRGIAGGWNSVGRLRRMPDPNGETLRPHCGGADSRGPPGHYRRPGYTSRHHEAQIQERLCIGNSCSRVRFSTPSTSSSSTNCSIEFLNWLIKESSSLPWPIILGRSMLRTCGGLMPRSRAGRLAARSFLRDSRGRVARGSRIERARSGQDYFIWCHCRALRAVHCFEDVPGTRGPNDQCKYLPPPKQGGDTSGTQFVSCGSWNAIQCVRGPVIPCFHGGNTGSNSVGDATFKSIACGLCTIFSWAQKGTTCDGLAVPFAPSASVTDADSCSL